MKRYLETKHSSGPRTPKSVARSAKKVIIAFGKKPLNRTAELKDWLAKDTAKPREDTESPRVGTTGLQYKFQGSSATVT